MRKNPPRTRRAWAADIGLVLAAACFALVTAENVPVADDLTYGQRIADQLGGALACVALFWRRRWPVQLTVALLVGAKWGHYLAGPAMVAVYTVASTRPWRTTAWIAGAAFVPLPFFLAQLESTERARAESAVAYFAMIAAAIGWGLFRRSRQQLIESLRERAERAEEDAALRAERAQRRAREDIAREMHDVLAHRLSLLSVHAGALEFNPGAAPAEVRRAAGVIRDSAHQALEDLRQVIGVLRSGPADPARPQPTLADVPRLVAESREAGAVVRYSATVAGEPPAGTGRTAYRVVQEALTNARKHAPGTPVTVSVRGGPGAGLTVSAVNPLAAGAVASGSGGPIPGAGQGLLGLAERTMLAGGRLEHGPVEGEFRVTARLPWAAEPGCHISGP
ncbi:sensor histidine kinase [Streptomyces smaragdinus]|nr:histidine kinase [Streptomyces smaragdinus]